MMYTAGRPDTVSAESTFFSPARATPSEPSVPPEPAAEPSAGLPPEQAVRIIRKNGAENVFLGSDSPWATTAHALDYLLKLPLTDREKELIMGENAARLLGLKP